MLQRPSRFPVPAQPPLDKRDSQADYADPLAPNEPGLPLFTTRTSPMSAVEVVDSSSARRRAVEGQQPEVVSQFQVAEEEEDKGHRREEGGWPTTGIGMEEQTRGVVIPTGRKEFNRIDDDDKWNKHGKVTNQSWVSPQTRRFSEHHSELTPSLILPV